MKSSVDDSSFTSNFPPAAAPDAARTFLSAAFPNKPDGAMPWVAGFDCNPYHIKAKWKGQPVDRHIPDFIADNANCYVAVSSFNPAPDGSWHRRKAQFAGLHILMIDDVGTGPSAKVKEEQVVMFPSYRVATSPDNEQVGYFIDPPCTDRVLAEAVIAALIEQGLATAGKDPGQAGVTRYGRLPVGINNKPATVDYWGSPWPVAPTFWNPERRYTIEELISGFGLVLKKPGATSSPPADGTASTAPADGEDSLLHFLAEQNRLLGPATDEGWIPILCPWCDEHTDKANTGTAFAPAGTGKAEDGRAYGGPRFKCHHGHCESRTGKDLTNWAVEAGWIPPAKPTKQRKVKEAAPQATTARQITIQCIPGELPEMVDQAEAALCKYESNFYQRSGQLVRWCMSHAETVRGITRPGGAVIILNQDTDYLLDRLNRLISWERWNMDREEYVPCNAPRTVASTMLARRGMWNAQPLVAAINAPTLRPDGSILDAPGYDAATGLLFVNTAVDFPPIPEAPSRKQAEAALAFIFDEVLSGFPFAAPHDRAAALSAIFTGCIRHSLKNAPMHTFNAPVMASGKSLLADVVALIATGHPATVMSYTPDGDEMRKRVLSVLMQGDLVVNLDNVEEPLASQTLCSVLTQESFTDRILGVNKTGTAPTLCCWIATGNNLVVAGDLTTRIVPCNLDPMVERPEEREFQRNLYDWIPIHRPRLVQAILIVLRSYIAAGKPKQPIKNFARFEDWTGLVRSALIWLGEADPLTGREAIEDGDPIRVKLRVLLLAWFAAFKTAPATSKEAVLRAGETELDNEGQEQPRYPGMKEALDEFFSDKAGKISSNSIGYFLRQYAGRIIDGARFEAYGGNAARSAWRVVVVNETQFKKGKISNPPDYPNNPNHPNVKKHPKPAETAGNPHSTVAPPPAEGWDGCHSWDVSPGPEILPEKISAAAAELATVFAGFRGWVTEHDIAKKAGWPPAQTAAALAELVAAGLAKQSGKLYKPVTVAEVQG